MKKIKFLTSNLLLVMMCFMFAACPPDPEPAAVVKLDLIGVWKYSHSNGYDLYQFNNDGTGSGIESDGYYWNFKYDLNTETLRLVYTKENESAEIWNIDIISNSSIEINNEMVLTKTTEKVERYKAVDLGLSVKWATCNVGASRAEDYGDYFAWGETAKKSDYNNNTYEYYVVIGYYVHCIYIGSDIRGTQYDVATVKWGNNWRMPTKDEIKELCSNCTWEWISRNGVNGYLVTGPNSNNIFLPASGYRSGTNVYGLGSFGNYWSATLYEDDGYDAYGLFFGSDYWEWAYGARYGGLTVRPVTE